MLSQGDGNLSSSLRPSRREEWSFLFCFHFWNAFCKFAMDWRGERGQWNIGIDFGIIFKESRMSGENFG